MFASEILAMTMKKLHSKGWKIVLFGIKIGIAMETI